MSRLMTTLLSLIFVAAAAAVQVDESSFSSTPRANDTDELIVPRIDQPPTIDGDLADACWDKAAVVKSFWLAGTTQTAEDQTIAWLGFDKDNLYVGWACLDRKLDGREVAHDDNAVWKQDAVEIFLSPERDATTERQFILAASGSTFDRRPGKEYGEGGKGWNPTWESKTKVQSWGYTAEMRIPLAELTDIKKYPVDRGTVWSMKLTRHDKGDFAGTRTSSWTRIGLTTADRRATGKLTFEDRNLLANGGAELGDDGPPQGWHVEASNLEITTATSTQQKTEGNRSAAITIRGRKVPGAQARVGLGASTIPAAPAETTYAFSADIMAVSADETLVAYVVAFQGKTTEQINFKHNAGWQRVKALITAEAGQATKLPVLQAGPVSSASKKDEGGGVVYIDNVRLEIVDAQEIGLDPDSYCLTGNAVDAYRTRNRRIDGTYTYTQPQTTDPWFPHYFAPGTGPDQDYGLYRGDVPFSKGRLTDGQLATTVNWPTFWEGHQGHDITFDLKREYHITRVVVKTSWAGQRMTHLYLKSPGEQVFTLVASTPDHVAFKTAGIHGETMPRTDEQVLTGINQTARWVRVQAETRAPGQFAEIEIWGRDPSQPGTTAKRIPYRQSNGATPIPNPTGQPAPTWDVPPVFPLPQEMKLEGQAVALRQGLLIHYEPVSSERARITAEVLRDELKLCMGIDATIAPASSEGKAAILVGEATDSPHTAAAMRKLEQTVTAQSPGPEGYVFATTDGRVVIAGSDPRGAFYGTQTLLTLARQAKSGGWEVPGALIRDWPDMPIRIIEGRAIPSEGLVRALARFRVRYYTAKFQYIHQTVAHDAFAERYFVSFIPFLDFNTTVLHQDPTLTERPAEERLEDVPQDSRRNANVGHPRTWEIYFAELDKWLPKFHGDILYIGMDETHHYSAGSRWNVSPESRALNMSAGALLAYTINKIDQKAKQYGKRLFMHDTPFCRDWTLSYSGDPDPDWSKAIPHLPKDLMFNVWHWNKKWVLDRLGAKHGFDLVYLCTGERDWRHPGTVDPNEDVMPFEFPGYFKGINNYMAESSFTVSKLLETMWVGWNCDATRPKDPSVNAAVARYVLLWNQLHMGEAMPPSLVAQPDDFMPVDLSKAANRSRIDEVPYDGEGWVDMGPNVDMRALPAGTFTTAGVPFNIIDEAKNNNRSVVMTHNAMYTDRTLPDTVEIDVNGLKASSLLFLHCLDNAPGWNYLRRYELAGFYFIVFEDGTFDRHQITYHTSIGTWDGQHYPWEYAPAGESMTYGEVAWTGQTMSGMTAKLYRTEWVNPKPNVPIRKVIMRSTYDATPMNPMLLAMTAVHPRVATATGGTAPSLPSADVLAPPRTVGVPYDLAGGKDESELRYVAPDGTVIEADRLHNGLSDRTGNAGLANDWRSYVGHVTIDGHQSARIETLRFVFPKPTALTGVLVTGSYREQRKAANFASMVYRYFVDVSADDGKTWKQVAATECTSPEEHGPVWVPLPDEPVRLVRLRQSQCEGTPDYHGYSRVMFYRKP